MPSLTYLAAKAAEYNLILSRLTEVLKKPEGLTRQPQVIERLREEVEDATQQLTLLERVVGSGMSVNTGRGLVVTRDISYSIYIVAHYLPVLERLDPSVEALSELVLTTARACGMGFVSEVAIRQDGPLAALPYRPETPLIFVPPKAATSLLEMPGLYHELGHLVFAQYERIGAVLDGERLSHYEYVRASEGPTDPDRAETWRRSVDEAAAYWQREALNEIFCDIFGSLTCGPAHFASTIDMALKYSDDPFVVHLDDPHPPMAARVYVAYDAIAEVFKTHPTVLDLKRAWDDHLSTYDKGSRYTLVCPDTLLNRFLGTAVRALHEVLPTFREYESPLPMRGTPPPAIVGQPISEVVNIATQLLFEAPSQYAAWERQALSALNLT